MTMLTMLSGLTGLSVLPLLTRLWAALPALAQQTPDPNDVKPGLLGFVVFVFLGLAVVFLAFSFRKQLRKVDFEEKPRTGRGRGDAPDTGQNG